jgi:hypothetical protein
MKRYHDCPTKGCGQLFQVIGAPCYKCGQIVPGRGDAIPKPPAPNRRRPGRTPILDQEIERTLLREGAMTAAGIAIEIGSTYQSVRKALQRLHRIGAVAPVGQAARDGKVGAPPRLWELCESE